MGKNDKYSADNNLAEQALVLDMWAKMLQSGVPILDGLQVLGESFPNYNSAFGIMAKDVLEGKSLDGYFEKQTPVLFHPLTRSLIHLGEECGALDAIIEKLSDYIQLEAEVKQNLYLTEEKTKDLLFYRALSYCVGVGVPLAESFGVVSAYLSFPPEKAAKRIYDSLVKGYGRKEKSYTLDEFIEKMGFTPSEKKEIDKTVKKRMEKYSSDKFINRPGLTDKEMKEIDEKIKKRVPGYLSLSGSKMDPSLKKRIKQARKEAKEGKAFSLCAMFGQHLDDKMLEVIDNAAKILKSEPNPEEGQIKVVEFLSSPPKYKINNTFSKALAKHPKYFSHFVVKLVETGEICGILDTTLNKIADHYEKKFRLENLSK